MRGGEKMLEALLELFPNADIFTHVYDPSHLPPTITRRRVYTSFINRLPLARRLYPLYLPLMPAALCGFDLQNYDLVISSEAGPAKGVVPAPDAYHLCYCHSPMRYIWDLLHEYCASAGTLGRLALRLFAPRLRVWDVVSANLVDRFITNSSWTARRIRRYYNREAEEVYGPADVERNDHTTRARSDYYLFFGQLATNKRVDIAIEACLALKRPLVVAGGGAARALKRKYGKSPFVRFVGRVSDDDVRRYYAGARALLFPGVEDMGLVPIEANAAGCPVIAYRKGGVLDTILEGVTGVFFDEQTAASLAGAIVAFEAREGAFGCRAPYWAWTRQFSRAAFLERVRAILAERRRV
jgi:glycosyltransferase involved in cell wall biosynthesis